MSITQRGSSYQVVLYHHSLPAGRFRKQFTDRREAELWELDAKAKLIRGEPLEGSGKATDSRPQTLGELQAYVWERSWKHARSANTAKRNSDAVVSILGADTPLRSIKAFEVDRLAKELLRRGDAHGTINRKLAALSKMLTVAYDLELIDRKPKMERFKETQGRIRRLMPAEEQTLLRYYLHIGAEDMHDYVVVSIDTGIRKGEAKKLTGLMIHDGVLTLPASITKTNRERSIPLTPRAAEVLAKRGAGKPGALFPGLTDGRVAHYWGRAAEVMELDEDPEFVPHIMRHEFCSRLADAGANSAVIMKLAGHSTLAMSNRYTHVSDDALKAAIGRLGVAVTTTTSHSHTG
jgi:integrase